MAYSQEFGKRERQVFQEDGHGEGDEHREKSHSKREGEKKREGKLVEGVAISSASKPERSS